MKKEILQKIKFIITVPLLFINFSGWVHSQNTGTLTGKVTLANGTTPVAGSEITLFRDSVMASSTTTNSTGTYQFIDLSSGTYDVGVTATGFPSVRRMGLTVNSGQTTTNDVSLETFTVELAPEVIPNSITGVDVTPIINEWISYFPPNNIQCIIREGNYLWLGTYRNGLLKWNLTNNAYRSYTTTDGLVDNDIKSIAIDSTGTKWFGTVQGLSKFDGTNFTTEIRGNSTIKIDKDDTKWFITANGIEKFDGTNWTWYYVNEKVFYNFHSLAIDKEGIKWLVSRDGLYKFDGTTWISFRAIQSVTSNIAIDNNGNKWFSIYDKLCKFDGKTLTTYTNIQGFENNSIQFIAIDKDGSKWISTTNPAPPPIPNFMKSASLNSIPSADCIIHFDDKKWTIYTSTQSLMYDDVLYIEIDNYGNKWFCNYNYGFTKFDGNNWTMFKPATELNNDYVTSVAIDLDGTKWFGTLGGITKFDGSIWTNYTTTNSSLTYDYISSIVIDNTGTKWFGTSGGGVNKFDGIFWTTFNTNNSGLANNGVRSIAIDRNNNKWFGTAGGISKFDGNNWITYTIADGLINNSVVTISIDKDDNKWIGTTNGISKFNGTNWISYTTNQGLANNFVTSIVFDKNNTKFFGTNGGGISRFDDINWKTYIPGNSELTSNSILSFAIDKNNCIWVGTVGQGACKFDGTNWTKYNTKKYGLEYSRVLSIAVEKDDSIWLGTDKGIRKYNPNFSISTVQIFGTIVGKVTRSDTMTLIQGAIVELLSTGVVKSSTTTGIDGTYKLINIPPGIYDIKVTKSGFLDTMIRNIEVMAGQTSTVDFVLKQVADYAKPTEPGKIKIIGGSHPSSQGAVNPVKGEKAVIGFKGSSPGTYTLRVYNTIGERVYDTSEYYNEPEGVFEWFPRQNLAPDVYIVHIEGPGIKTYRKIAIVR